ncbi:MAG TPA: hypothetical protein VFF30_18990 [Nitrososphaerales archaeon]|nr:hypothetical protein [Nitrososphaerales archaeon]
MVTHYAPRIEPADKYSQAVDSSLRIVDRLRFNSHWLLYTPNYFGSKGMFT